MAASFNSIDSQQNLVRFRMATPEEYASISPSETCCICLSNLVVIKEEPLSSETLFNRRVVVHDGSHPIHKVCFANWVNQAHRPSMGKNRAINCLTCNREANIDSLPQPPVYRQPSPQIGWTLFKKIVGFGDLVSNQ